jgi:hypothetical protein
MALHHLFDDGQAKASAARVSNATACEPFKHRLSSLWRNARPGIGNAQDSHSGIN